MKTYIVFHERRLRGLWNIHLVRFSSNPALRLLGCLRHSIVSASRAFCLAMVCHCLAPKKDYLFFQTSKQHVIPFFISYNKINSGAVLQNNNNYAMFRKF